MPPPPKRNPYLTDAERAAIRTLQKADAPRAMADYQAAEQEIRERTAKLRKARRAREASDDPADDDADPK